VGQTPVVASIGPVELVVGLGQQISLPLSSLFFEDGMLKASGALYTANKAAVDSWLQYLAGRGLITPAPAAAPKQALLVAAKNPGSTGNDIVIVISALRADPADATKQIFDAKLTQTDTYENLTKDTVKTILGTAAAFTSGDRPGLVFVSTSGATSVPKEGTYTPATFVVDLPPNTGSGTAFKLTYRVQDAAATATAKISDLDLDTGTFTLVATWAKAVAGIRVPALGTSFSDHVVVTLPGGGAATDADVPAPGTVLLAGGSDSASAIKASAAVPASD
jgi:hypothetical protein